MSAGCFSEGGFDATSSAFGRAIAGGRAGEFVGRMDGGFAQGGWVAGVRADVSERSKTNGCFSEEL